MKKSVRNPILIALCARHKGTTTKMRDRRDRRPKDARNRRWIEA